MKVDKKELKAVEQAVVKTETAVAVKTPVKAEMKASEPEMPAKAEKAPAKKAEKKPAAKKTAEKKAAVKKTAAKKTVVKRAPKKEGRTMAFVQFGGAEFDVTALLETAKADYAAKSGKKAKASDDFALYIKPEEQVAYYTVNGDGNDSFRIEF